MYSLVYTPFKVGSCTFFDRMVTVDQNFIKLHSGTTKIEDVANEFPLKTIFTIIRHPAKLYPSAFFQDIDCASYAYYFGSQDDVLSTPTDVLIEYFLKFKWSSFDYLSIKKCLEEIENYTCIPLFNYLKNFDKRKGYCIIQSPRCTVCILLIDVLNDSRFSEMLSVLGYKIPETTQSNIGAEKWYCDKYREFIEKLEYLRVSFLSEDDKWTIDTFL